jgi:hypothetical protein
MNWTMGENNHPDMNMALLTHLNHNAENSDLLAAAPAEPARRHEDAV